MRDIEVLVGDITTLQVDAVVNAANDRLRAGGGVCGAIFRAAGHDDLQAACDEIGGCPTGEAVATSAFGLSANGVTAIIHAVGPVWDGDGESADRLLRGAYSSSLDLATAAGLRSIAFPAISTGIYGFPADRAARVAIRAIDDHADVLERVVLVAFDDASAATLRAALDEVRPR